MDIYIVTAGTTEKVTSVAEAQTVFEHYVINEQRCTVWRGDPNDDGREVWHYDPDAVS